MEAWNAAAKGQHLAVVAERAARRGNVQVLGGISFGIPSTLLLLYFYHTFASSDLVTQTGRAYIEGPKINRPSDS